MRDSADTPDHARSCVKDADFVDWERQPAVDQRKSAGGRGFTPSFS
jgi:hypothetical protein